MKLGLWVMLSVFAGAAVGVGATAAAASEKTAPGASSGTPVLSSPDLIVVKEWNKKNDGFITRDEFIDGAAKLFDRLDVQRNGLLEGEAEGAGSKTWYGDADKGASKGISLREFILESQETFVQADLDRDGQLSLLEFERVRMRSR